MDRLGLHLALFTLVVAAGGCPGGASIEEHDDTSTSESGQVGTACEPGASAPCVCPGGLDGVQLCLDDGAAFGACMCSGAGTADDGSTSSEPTGTTGGTDDDGGTSTTGDRQDDGTTDDTGASSSGSTGEPACAPAPVTCDDQDDDLWHALGLNCEGGPTIDGTTAGDPLAFFVHTGNLGTFEPPPFPPREGDKFVIMSSGVAEELTMVGAEPSTGHEGNDPAFDLPPPLDVVAVSRTEDCADDSTLVGTGDCSNSLEAQWSQGSGAYDYAEMRINAQVPEGIVGFSYSLAMFSTEYPDYYQTQYNDMYIAWLESEAWTGNISFDAMGNPISLNAAFLAYKDAPNPFDCPEPCTAAELAGTAAQGHASTTWLSTEVGVNPGENIEVVFAIFDMSDQVLDSMVLLDNWQWTCEGGPPQTNAL